MAVDPSGPGHLPTASFASVLTQSPTPMQDGPSPRRGMHKGEPAGFFPPDLIGLLAQPYRFALVGKFSKGRPTMEKIHEFFKAQDFVDHFSVGLLDPRHIIVNFQGERDFLRFYSRMLWYVGDFPMRMFKWSSDFHVERESSIVPIWFKFPKLPVHFFNPKALFFLASLFGSPLRLDSATQSLKRPSVARIQVEIDLLKKLPSRVWIGTGENQGFWQKVEADEELPLYCPHCWHVGHSEDICTLKHPELKAIKKTIPKAVQPSAVTQAYRPVQNQELRPSTSGLQANDKLLVPTYKDNDTEPPPSIPANPNDPTVPPELSVPSPVLVAIPDPGIVPPAPRLLLPGGPSSDHEGDTDEEIEMESPGHAPIISAPAAHSDTDDPVRVSTLEEFRSFAGTLAHLVPQPPQEEP